MEPDHRPVSEDIISLTLEIVFLLTGEDYKVVGKSSEFANKGILGSKGANKRPMVPPTPRSMTADKKVLEVSNKIIHLLTGEVWRFLGHVALCNDVVKESLKTIISPGSSKVSYNKTTQAGKIKQEPALFEEDDLPCANISKPPRHAEANNRLAEKRIVSRLSVSELKAESEVSEEEEDVAEGGVYMMPQTMRLYKNVLPDFGEEEPHPTSDDCRPESPSEFSSYAEKESIPYKEKNVVDGYNIRDMEEDSGEESRSPQLEEDPSITVIEYNGLYGSTYSPASLGQRQPSSEIQDCFAAHADLTKHHQHSLLNFDCGSCSAKNSMLIKNEKQLSCPDCGKTFSAISHLIRHQRIHTGEKPFACADCGRSFNQKATLIKHRRTHTGEKPFVCSDCGKCFTSSANLTQHQRVHTGEKPYACDVCGKTFRSSPNLITHQRIHTGEKPYFCAICGKFFANSSVLVRHQKTHTGEKPYSCNVCGKGFIQGCQLNKHRRVHTHP